MSEVKHIAITGGRDKFIHRDQWVKMYEILGGIYNIYSDKIFIHYGDCSTGIDKAIKIWVHVSHIQGQQFFAGWKTYGKAAGPIRNREMIEGCEMLIAFPGGKGTADCIKAAQEKNIRVMYI